MQRDKIYVSYGAHPKKMVQEILSSLQVEKHIKKDALIGVKPNLVVAKPAASGATTSPELVEGVVEYLQSNGLTNIVILEGSWVGDRTARAFEVCGYSELSKKYRIPLIDLQKDTSRTVTVKEMELAVCEAVLSLDYLINMPVLKGHCQTKITCALKNLKGCIPNSEKRRFHTMGLHKPIAYLNKAIKTDLIIMDGLMGDLDFEEGGNPVQMDRIIVGFDPVLIDSYVASLLGYAPEEIPYIKMAERIGVGRCLTSENQVHELHKEYNTRKIPRTRAVERLGKYTEEKDACSACYGSLIHALARLDEQGLLTQMRGKIHIGQGYKGKTGQGVGVGVCTKSFEINVPGCPPTAKDIIAVIQEDLDGIW